MDDFKKIILTDDILKSFYESLSPRYNKGTAFKGDDGGSSGSWFFFSHDKKFIVKTMTSSELKLFTCGFLDKFTNHLQMKKNTLLAKTYGVFTVKTKYINEKKEFNVLVMEGCAMLRNPD